MKWYFVGLVAMSVTLAAGTASAASFDCNAATTDRERAICNDQQLSKLDEQMAAAYVKAADAALDPGQIKSRQRAWLRDLDQCRADAECLKQAYRSRMADLEGGSSEPAEPAATPVEPAAQQTSPSPQSPSQATLSQPKPAPSSNAGESDNRDLLLGGLIVGVLVGLIAVFLTIKKLADYTARRYGYNMILNWWNLLHLFAFACLGFFALFLQKPLVGLAVWAGVTLILLVVNVRRTNLWAGIAMTIIQPFAVVTLFMGIQLIRAAFERPRHQRA